VADLKIGILGEMNRNSANDSEREAFSASRESAFLKGYSRPRSSGESKNATLEAIRRPVASARSRPLLDCAHTTESYGPEPPTPADLKREADHEMLV
jgi:hypothetical protein